jgi:hypothetical protein
VARRLVAFTQWKDHQWSGLEVTGPRDAGEQHPPVSSEVSTNAQAPRIRVTCKVGAPQRIVAIFAQAPREDWA